MSRVLFVSLDESDVVARCTKQNVGISAIENLPEGGVRLVCMSADGAAIMKRKFKSQLIKEAVTRQVHRPASPLW
jgi:hypothetical protein